MEDTQPVSKVLVLDESPACLRRIKAFCEANKLVALRVQEENIMSVLKSNVDLGGIFISENLSGKASAGVEIGHDIHHIRPELPLFLRRDAGTGRDELSAEEKKSFRASYTIDSIDDLRKSIDDCIFNMMYPNALLRGINEMTIKSLQSQFKDLELHVETPYIVRDRLIFGEIFTLIPIESPWCRGYMSLQTEEFSLQNLVLGNKTHIAPDEGDDFRNLNSILGETTNLIWGAFKNRYTNMEGKAAYSSQVPIIINHLHRYISFGSEQPQLCYKCTLTDPNARDSSPMVIYQRFAFNLSWSPEDFRENDVSVDNLVAVGDLELF